MNPTSPFQFGDEVEIVGPGKMGNPSQIGQNFIIEQIKDGYYSDSHTAFWYPASSLKKIRVVEDKEEPLFKVGEWVQVMGSHPHTFQISSIQLGCLYSGEGESGWHMGGNLQKVDGPELQIGDYAKVVSGEDVGKIFQISHIIEPYSGCQYYSDSPKYAWAASSLRKLSDNEVKEHLAPEFQIGDYAEVVLPDNPFTGQIGQVSSIGELTIALYGMGIWSRESVRKLTPEEVTMHTGTIGYKMQEFQAEMDKAKDALREILAPLVDERLSAIETQIAAYNGDGKSQAKINCDVKEGLIAIESQQADINSWMDRFAKTGAEWEKRLALVEAFQKEQIENALGHKTLPRAELAAMIADGTLEVSDFREKDTETQRKIIRELEDDLANGCDGMTCARCVDEVESDGIRIAALDYAIRALRMPDMDNDPEFAHGAADVLEEMMEEMKK